MLCLRLPFYDINGTQLYDIFMYTHRFDPCLTGRIEMKAFWRYIHLDKSYIKLLKVSQFLDGIYWTTKIV